MVGEPARRPSRELRDVLERLDGLPERDLLDVYERLALELAVEPFREPRRDRRVRERADALRNLDAARTHLDLAEGERLTAKRFTTAGHELGNGWNASRVVRAWGTWRNATDVLAGANPPRRAEQEAVALVRGLRRSSHRPAVEGLREWLAENPSQISHASYKLWAQDRNRQLDTDEPRYLSANGVCSAMGVTFAVARRRAQAGLSPDEPQPGESYTVGNWTLITLGGFAERLGLTTTGLRRRARRTPLPHPLLHHEWRDYWAETDARDWQQGKTVERDEGALDTTILDRGRLARLLDVTAQTVHDRWRDARHLLPPANGLLYEHPWWDAHDAERWKVSTTGTRLTRHGDRRANRLQLDGDWLLATAAVCEMLDITVGAFESRRRHRPLQPATIFSTMALWLLKGVEAWARGEDVSQTVGAYDGRLLNVYDLARRLGKTEPALRRGLARGMDRYPRPDGTIGRSDWWDANRVERWIADTTTRRG